MTPILLGIAAALLWGIHDFLARLVSRSLGSLQAALLVLVFGAGVLLTTMHALGEPFALGSGSLWLVGLSGIAYALALKLLYDALAIGPVSLVVPITGAYPALTMLWAVANGARPSLLTWLAIAGVMTGVALVARFAPDAPQSSNEPLRGTRREAILYSALSSLFWAVSTLAGQASAATTGELGATFWARLFAIGIIAPLTLRSGSDFSGARRWLPVLVLMGALDAFGIASVVAAGKLPNAELSIVVASCFGAVTVTLAILFLKERPHPVQFAGMLLILAGIATLSGRE